MLFRTPTNKIKMAHMGMYNELMDAKQGIITLFVQELNHEISPKSL